MLEACVLLLLAFWGIYFIMNVCRHNFSGVLRLSFLFDNYLEQLFLFSLIKMLHFNENIQSYPHLFWLTKMADIPLHLQEF